MHRHLTLPSILVLLSVASALAQSTAPSAQPRSNGNISATGRMMPPTTGRQPGAPLKSNTETEMLKAQKAAEERNKAWDTKTRRTMGTICNGC